MKHFHLFVVVFVKAVTLHILPEAPLSATSALLMNFSFHAICIKAKKTSCLYLGTGFSLVKIHLLSNRFGELRDGASFTRFSKLVVIIRGVIHTKGDTKREMVFFVVVGVFCLSCESLDFHGDFTYGNHALPMGVVTLLVNALTKKV